MGPYSSAFYREAHRGSITGHVTDVFSPCNVPSRWRYYTSQEAPYCAAWSTYSMSSPTTLIIVPFSRFFFLHSDNSCEFFGSVMFFALFKKSCNHKSHITYTVHGRFINRVRRHVNESVNYNLSNVKFSPILRQLNGSFANDRQNVRMYIQDISHCCHL